MQLFIFRDAHANVSVFLWITREIRIYRLTFIWNGELELWIIYNHFYYGLYDNEEGKSIAFYAFYMDNLRANLQQLNSLNSARKSFDKFVRYKLLMELRRSIVMNEKEKSHGA